MKKIIIAAAAFVCTLAATTTYAQQSKGLNIGDDMPMVTDNMKNATDGSNKVYYKAAEKNGLLVMFSCNTCPFVVKNEITTKKTIAYAKEHGVGVVIINSNEAKRSSDDSYGAMKSYAIEQQYEVPYLIDENSKLADIFGANHTPEIYLFNNQNKLVYKGAMNDDPRSPENAKTSYISNAIDATIRGKKPNPATTKSIGCSIKRNKS